MYRHPDTEGPFDVDEDSAYESGDNETQVMTFDGLLTLEPIELETGMSGSTDRFTWQGPSGPEAGVPDGADPQISGNPDSAEIEHTAPSAQIPLSDDPGPVDGIVDSVTDFAGLATGPAESEDDTPEPVPEAGCQPRRSAGGFEGQPGLPRHPFASPRPSTTPQETKMLNIDFEVLSQSLDETKSILKQGLDSADIFDSVTGLSLVGIDSSPAACALLTESSAGLGHSLTALGYGRGRYHLIELSDNKLIVVLWHGEDLLESWVLNLERVNLGILFALAIPRALTAVEKARP